MIQKPPIGILLAFLLAYPAHAAELRLTINGVPSDGGELLIRLYDYGDDFLRAVSCASKRGRAADSDRLIGVAIRAKSGPQSVVFTRLLPGRYAAIVVHDENDDGRLAIRTP